MFGQRFALEFTRRRKAPVAWLLLSAGVAAAVAAGVSLHETWTQQKDMNEQLARLERALAREGQTSRKQASRGTDRAGADAARTDAERIWGDLQRPWNDLFDLLQHSAQPPVRLLQIGVDGRFSEMQMQAEARSLEDVFRFAESIGGKGPVTSARLTSHEWRTTGTGQRVVTARVVAALTPVRPEAKRADAAADPTLGRVAGAAPVAAPSARKRTQ